MVIPFVEEPKVTSQSVSNSQMCLTKVKLLIQIFNLKKYLLVNSNQNGDLHSYIMTQNLRS